MHEDELLVPDSGKKPDPAPPAGASKPAKPRAGAGDEDLSAEIVRAVPREPGEQVTCRRITRNNYRCNWWSAGNRADYDNPSMGGMLVTINRITRSAFLHVTRAPAAAEHGEGAEGATSKLHIVVKSPGLPDVRMT